MCAVHTCSCAGEEVAGKLSMRVQQLDVAVETKTRDNVFVTLVVSVQYQAMGGNLYDAFYRVRTCWLLLLVARWRPLSRVLRSLRQCMAQQLL